MTEIDKRSRCFLPPFPAGTDRAVWVIQRCRDVGLAVLQNRRQARCIVIDLMQHIHAGACRIEVRTVLQTHGTCAVKRDDHEIVKADAAYCLEVDNEPHLLRRDVRTVDRKRLADSDGMTALMCGRGRQPREEFKVAVVAVIRSVLTAFAIGMRIGDLRPDDIDAGNIKRAEQLHRIAVAVEDMPHGIFIVKMSG